MNLSGEIQKYLDKMSKIEDKESKIYQTYAEAVSDLKILLSGGSIPRLHKESDQVCDGCQ